MEDTQTTGSVAPSTEDTVDTQSSEASQAVEQNAPEATSDKVETQEVATPKIEAEDTAEKLYAGKYKTPEDMEKAYKELNSKFTNTTQEKAELSRILNEAFAEPPQPVQPQQAEYNEYEEPNPVNQEIEGLKRSQAVMNFVMAHNNADPTTMTKVLAEDPLVKQISGHEAKLEYAYLKSQGMSQPKAIEEAKKVAAQQTQAKIVEKQGAQVESPAASRPTDEKAELQQRMQSGPIADREQARRQYIKKYLI